MDVGSLSRRIVVVTPVLNDWASVDKLIENLAEMEGFARHSLHIIVVDDGSPDFDPPHAQHLRGPVKRIQVLRLKANQGHQRAIALGLAHADRELEFDCALVMDSDGEDRPEDAVRLLQESEKVPETLIVARRTKRSESLLFRLFYVVYKFMFHQLTGKPISFGNFSMIPRARVSNVLYNPGVWNNFAATLLRSRVPISFVRTRRGRRYFGSSTMNFSSLMVHGMSAISVFSDIVIGRIIVGLGILTALFALAVAAVIAAKFGVDYYNIEGYFIPGYTTNVVLILSNMLMSALFVGFVTILSLLATRSTPAALPSQLLDHLTASVHEVARELQAVGTKP